MKKTLLTLLLSAVIIGSAAACSTSTPYQAQQVQFRNLQQ